jgi:hypothetical protein
VVARMQNHIFESGRETSASNSGTTLSFFLMIQLKLWCTLTSQKQANESDLPQSLSPRCRKF